MEIAKYVGWISGKYSDRGRLTKLGVKGKMVWVQKEVGEGWFEQCECSEKTIERLRVK